ncbi:MAG: IclR family transcriptional regulator, partial [Spirochaetia bacterium]|nr:IclR family transcriptional regulator [Spirochaetia bacterium]
MNNTVTKAMAIIELLSLGKNMGTTEISEELGLPKSTAHNIIETLSHYSIIEKNLDTNKYHLGLKLIELGSRAQSELDITRIANPYLKGINMELDETVHLTVLDREEVLYVDCVESKKRLRTYSVIGVRAPLYCTAVGKAILAFLPEKDITKILQEKGLERITENTITKPETMKFELEHIRKDGFAVDNMEHEDHLRCVGAPIFNSRGEVIASISISGPTSRNTIDRI